MCGIVGILQYESAVPREVRHRALRILFSESMLKTETRGEDATGIYQVHTDGDWAMSKKGIRASEWLFQDRSQSNDPVVYNDFMDSWLEHPQELTALVGHCRKATVGSRGRNNDDNHPFAVQLDEENAILGIHNGTLNNHETIFRRLPKLLKRQGQVDSESIFHLLFHLSEHGTKPWDAKMMTTLGKRLDGAAACIVVNTRFPNLVATWRFGRPMDFFLLAPLNVVVVCSEKKFVDAALEKYNFVRRLIDTELPPLETFDTSLTEKDFRIFDTSKPWFKGRPIYADLGKISVSGSMKTFQTDVEEGWGIPAAKTLGNTQHTGSQKTTGAQSGGQHAGTTNTQHVKVSKKQPTAGNLGRLPATTVTGAGKASHDEVVIAEVEIGSVEEAVRAGVRAKSLGVRTQFDRDKDIIDTLGITQERLVNLSRIELANLVAKAHFNLGYAVSRFDTKSETEKTRKGGRDLTKKLEKAEEKKTRAESRIWELKQLITILLALQRAEYGLTAENVGISLSAFVNLSESRQKEVRARADEIFSDVSVEKIVKGLTERYRQARRNKRTKERRAGSSED